MNVVPTGGWTRPPSTVPSVDDVPESQPIAWRHRHLLDVDRLSTAEIDLIMRTTDAMREVLARPIAKVPALRGRAVTILFYEASTRTRVSFEVAAKNLSADVVNIAAASSSVAKGESLIDTVKTVEALGAQMLVMRHSLVRGAVPGRRHLQRLRAQRRRRLARPPDPGAARPVHDARADARRVTGRPQGRDPRRPAPLAGGPLEHLDADGRRRRSLAVRAGHAGPRASKPGRAGARPGRRFHLTTSVDEALRDADVVMALRIQRERMAGGLLPSLREYAARYGLTRERLALARPDALVMHPGPMNEGVEIAPDVAAGSQSVITDQVTNGVAVRMAVLYLLAGTRVPS